MIEATVKQEEVVDQPSWIVPRIKQDHNLGKLLHHCWNRLHIEKPVFIILTGVVGTGKSRSIFLNIIDYWYKTFHQMIPPKNCFGVKFVKYIESLNVAQPYHIAALDEAGDIFNKGNDSRKRLNDLYESYGIIRERKVFTMVVMPSIFDLDNKFAQNSVTYWINVTYRIENWCYSCKIKFVGTSCPQCKTIKYREGCVFFDIYNQKRTRQILQRNEMKQIKSIHCGVNPLGSGVIKEYRGELYNYYSLLKAHKTDEKVKMLDKKYGITAEKEKQRSADEIREFIAAGKTVKQIADGMGVHVLTVHKILKSSPVKSLSDKLNV